MTEVQLLSVATVWHIEEMLGGSGDGFRDHPLLLPTHELGAGVEDFSKLTVKLPFRTPKRARLKEPEEMMVPLEKLCEKLGPCLQADSFEYQWYYLELLDRDNRVRPLCWISPELLYHTFADDRTWYESIGGLYRNPPPYPRSLLTMDDLQRTPPIDQADEQERSDWQAWLAETWQENEREWLGEGLLSYATMRPWTSQLRHDSKLRRGAPANRSAQRDEYVPLHQVRSRCGPDGFYWRMIPLYDERDLQLIWWAMKQDLYATSVFNLAAGPTQDKHLWERLEERFRIRPRRIPRYRYLIDQRESSVLRWTRDEGKSLAQIGQMLIDSGLYPINPAGPLLTQPLPVSRHEDYLPGARQVAARIRTRLQKRGLLEKLPPGRPRKTESAR